MKNEMNLPVYVTGDKEPLLMIHGIISDGSFFNNISEYLREDFKVISYDRRGYGNNEFSEEENYSIASQVKDAANILREYAGEPAWILGNSAGGLIAIELALRYPEMIRGLFLVEPAPVLNEDSERLISDWNEELNGYVREKHIKKALTAFGRVTGIPGGSANPGSTLEDLRLAYKNLNTFMYGELNEIQKYRPNADRIRSIIAPVRVVITEDGKESIFAKVAVSAADIMGWRADYVPGFHNAVKDKSEEFAIYLRKAIKEINTDE